MGRWMGFFLLSLVLGGSAAGCIVAPTVCSVGDTQDCTCSNGTTGTQSCTVLGTGYGSCSCGTSCTPASTQSCSCPGGTAGVETCNSAGTGYSGCYCGPSVAAATTVCVSWATSYCAEIARCNPADFARDYSGMPGCLSNQQAQCVAQLITPTVNITLADKMACGQARAVQSCTDFQNGVTPTACATPPGLSADGAACTFGAECISTFCQTPAGSSCGACSEPSTLGSSCPCSAGFSCVNSACVGLVPLMGTCSASQPCANGDLDACVIPTGQSTGTCLARATTVGASCGAGVGACDYYAGLYCNRTTHRCVAYDFVNAGSQCGNETDGGYALCNDATCINVTNSVGTCAARSGGGQACDPTATVGASCQPDAQCVEGATSTTGTCQLHGAAMCAQSSGGNDCVGVTDCATCASIPDCGWCIGTHTCLQGTASSSNDATCTGASWDWYGDSC